MIFAELKNLYSVFVDSCGAKKKGNQKCLFMRSIFCCPQKSHKEATTLRKAVVIQGSEIQTLALAILKHL